jgi:hypothetical protein
MNPMQTMKVHVSRKIYGAVLALSILGLAAGIYGLVIGKDYEQIKMALVVLFFVLTTIMCGRELMDDSPRIVVDARGIERRRHGAMTIGWEDIDGAYLKAFSRLFGGKYYVCLEMKNPGKYLEDMAWYWKLVAKLDRPKQLTPISLSLTGLDVDAQALMDAINSNIEEHRKQSPAA